MTKILVFAGSARKNSLNKKLAKLAANLVDDAGAEATYIDLKDFEMPLYDGDLEEENGIPENAKKLKQLFVESDGLFIASPEYNACLSPLLKNALDWISRPHEENEIPLVAFKGKVAALGSVSPGALGGVRGLGVIRAMLSNIGVVVTPSQVAIGSGFEAFEENGQLVNERQSGMLKSMVAELVSISSQLAK